MCWFHRHRQTSSSTVASDDQIARPPALPVRKYYHRVLQNLERHLGSDAMTGHLVFIVVIEQEVQYGET